MSAHHPLLTITTDNGHEEQQPSALLCACFSEDECSKLACRMFEFVSRDRSSSASRATGTILTPGHSIASTLAGSALAAAVALAMISLARPSSAVAETLNDALTRAYQENAVLNAQRSGALATRQNVTRAQAGYRPKLNASGDVGGYSESNRYADGSRSDLMMAPRGVGVSLSQNVFDGFRTPNLVRQAEALNLEADSVSRNIEQNTLLSAVAAYMDVLADTAILDRVRKSIAALSEQLRQIRGRHDFADVTKIDVAQVESRLASAKAQENVAEGNLRTSMANYRQIVGIAPNQLAPARAIDQFIPPSLDEVIACALRDNPAIHAAAFGVDSAQLQPAIIRGERLPTLTLNGTLARRHDVNYRGDEQSAASVVARISIPLYDGGEIAARTSQAKHIATQRTYEATAVRDQIRATASTAWAQFHAAKERVANQRTQLSAAKTALSGIREQWVLGDRTMREVLDAEQEFLSAEVNLIVAERDRIVASYAIAKAIGRLTLVSLSGISLVGADTMTSTGRTTSIAAAKHEKRATERSHQRNTALPTWSLRLSTR
jgi:outer membrane protein